MLSSIWRASLDDDVYFDASTHRLEQFIANLCGKESALFCITGTMSNQIAIKSALRDYPCSVLMMKECHMNRWEVNGISQFCGVGVTAVETKGKWLSVEEMETEWISRDIHTAPTKLVVLENTMNGCVWPLEEMLKVADWAKEREAFVHLDGARLWNASVESGHLIKEYADCVDSLSLCLSKGLGAPMGSILVGSERLISKARHYRKAFGGGWRQSGILAEMGMYAIENHVQRLQQDHKNAEMLANGLRELGWKVHGQETNMVWLDTSKHTHLQQYLGKQNIIIPAISSNSRWVTHLDINHNDISILLNCIQIFQK